MQLAAIGCPRIQLIDFDVVDLSNGGLYELTAYRSAGSFLKIDVGVTSFAIAGNGDVVHSNQNAQGLVVALDHKTGQIRWTYARDTDLPTLRLRHARPAPGTQDPLP